MAKDLLAPPKLPVRKYAMLAGGFCAVAIVAGVVFATMGMMGVGELLVRAAATATIAGATVWGYARLTRYAAQARPERMPLVHAATVTMGMAAWLAALSIMLSGASLGRATSSNLWMVPMMFGMTLAGAGITRRVGNSLHCPKCEYEYGFGSGDEADAPIRCPECGTGWLGSLKKGRRVRSARLMAVGIVIAIVVPLVGNPVFYLSAVARHLPTPVLYAALYASPSSAHTVWEELSTRPLNEKWTRIMATRVLHVRSEDQFNMTPSWWMGPTIKAGKLPGDLLEQFYQEGFCAELNVPERVMAGEKFTAALRVKHAANDGHVSMAIMFAGYSIDDRASHIGRSSETLWGFRLRPGVFDGYRDVQATELTAGHTGEMRVRVVYWIVYVPSFTTEPVWQADGTPQAPKDALWFKRVELERTVRVE